VKREDTCCPPPGPPFSKVRGVYAHIRKRPERVIGALDTYHSQAGHAVARVCQALGRQAIVYYPEYKACLGPRKPQRRAQALGADLIGLPAGRSCILFYGARKDCEGKGGYMMPNALKLDETVEETAREVPNRYFRTVVIPASSGTIAAGVIRGFSDLGIQVREFIIHLGYSRSHDQVLRYLRGKSGVVAPCTIVDEGYSYRDAAEAGPDPPWPCNQYYDLKTFRWWVAHRSQYSGPTLFWNIG